MVNNRNRIEAQILRKEHNQQSSSEIDDLVSIQQIQADMQESMEQTSKHFVNFWKELQDESPNFQYLGDVSHEITLLVNKIRANHKELINLSPTNLYSRMLYAIFLKWIVKDEFEAYDVYNE